LSLTDLDPAYHEAVCDLYYSSVEDGFAKSYPADIPHLDRIYQNFAHYAKEMVLQTAQVLQLAVLDTAQSVADARPLRSRL